MPVIPNRDLTESRLSAIIRRASRRQKQRLTAAMGWPPDVAKIPATVWLEIEREQAEETRVPLAMVYMTAGAVLGSLLSDTTGYQVDGDAVADNALAFGQQRALTLASEMAQHTRERLEGAVLKVRQGEIDKPAFSEVVDNVFSDERSHVAAVTETSAAQTGGEDTVRQRFEAEMSGTTLLWIWRHRTAIIRGIHPCPLCARLVGMSQNEWPAIDPEAGSGPPRHPNCDCVREAIVITEDEARRLTMTPPRGWDNPYRKHFDRIRDSRSPRDVDYHRSRSG